MDTERYVGKCVVTLQGIDGQPEIGPWEEERLIHGLWKHCRESNRVPLEIPKCERYDDRYMKSIGCALLVLDVYTRPLPERFVDREARLLEKIARLEDQLALNQFLDTKSRFIKDIL